MRRNNLQGLGYNEVVSIHAPARGATYLIMTPRFLISVSIHAPARGATPSMASEFMTKRMFQSTHPHGVRHAPRQQEPGNLEVSIHAPARGATIYAYYDTLKAIVSIHAPARGATFRTFLKGQEVRVSIHAPARGATGEDGCNCGWCPRFNPRTRTGCDPLPHRTNVRQWGFNPRTRTGCDKKAC